ncbi:MAG: biotin transporter BioY [Gemmatimonadaceae bacterium]
MERLAVNSGVMVDAVWPRHSAMRRVRDLILVLGGAMVIALSAHLEIPLTPVPITAQTFAVLLLAALYGSRRGAATSATYLFLGLVGLPVFAGGTAGIVRLLGPTGGYLIGYVPAAFLVGWLSERGWDRKPWSAALSMVAGNAIIYLTGVLWLSRFVGASSVWQAGVLPFLPGDAFKIVLATLLLPLGWRLVARPGRHHVDPPNEP